MCMNFFCTVEFSNSSFFKIRAKCFTDLFFINRYVKMGLQFSLCPRVYRDDRYFNDLLSQLSVFRDENTEAQRLKRFTPDHITQVVAGRARLEPDH